jgi:ABC-type amino acid transport substrate-binding protein
LHGALERTRPGYGAYEVQPFTEKASLARVIKLAIEGRLVNVLPFGVGQPGPERDMIPVPFPIDKGLLGYRVSLIDRRSQDRLFRVHSIEELRQLRVGQGSDWTDVRIYEHHRISVETTPEYGSLVLMLLHGRFDLFPRGLFEIAPELAGFGERYPDLAVEQHLLLHYPFCEVFYVNRSTPRLAARLTAGLERMVADGSFDALFAKYFGKLLANLHLRQRVVIELENPFLPAWVPLKRKELWFDPARLP